MKCEQCGNEDFAYIQARKPKVKTRWKIITFIVIIVTVSILQEYQNIEIIKNITTVMLLTEFAFFIGIFIYQWFKCREKHTKAICKKCQKSIWID